MSFTEFVCGCCQRHLAAKDHDYLYGSCHDCAWCLSLCVPETYDPDYKCHHGTCDDREQTCKPLAMEP